MILKTIKLENFRNYEQAFLELSPNINIFYGNNGQGKTNLLESIYVLAISKSHRSFIDNSLINKNQKYGGIVGVIRNDDVNTTLELYIDKKNKRLKKDHQEVKKISDYISNMNIIIFYPEDLDLIKSSPQIRRRFLNVELSQIYKNYIDLLSNYQNVIKIRNNYLKTTEIIDDNYLEILTKYLVDKAVDIYIYRYNFIKDINNYAKKIYEQLADIKGFNIKYKTDIIIDSCDKFLLEEKLLNKFKALNSSEKKFRSTLVGPHRDDLEIYIDDNNIRSFGSQGQQRMAVLAIKLSEIEIFKQQKNTSPILLLDDVFSELDDNKKNNLLKIMSNSIQTIITTTDLKNIDNELVKKAKLFYINNGQIEE